MKINSKTQKRTRIQLIDLEEVLRGRKKANTVKKSVSKVTTPKTTKKVNKIKVKKAPTKTTKTNSKLVKSNVKENEVNESNINSEFVFNGSAKKRENENSFTLTPDAQGAVGSVFTKEKVNIEFGFKCNFKFQMIGHGGADGLAFVIQNSKNTALTTGGGDLGYHNMEGGLIAVEFDVFRNDVFNDPYGQHVSVQCGKNNHLSAHHRDSIGSHVFQKNINDGSIIPVEIIYDSKDSSIKVYINSGSEKKLVINSTLKIKMPGNAFIGFTAACGYHSQKNIVQDFTFQSLKNVEENNKEESNPPLEK